MREDFNPEDMPIIEGLDLSRCKEFHIEDYFLSSHGTFDTKDCVSAEDLRPLFNKPHSWEEWMLSQIEQEGVEKYKAWYARMNSRCDLHSDLIEAHNKLFGTEEK